MKKLILMLLLVLTLSSFGAVKQIRMTDTDLEYKVEFDLTKADDGSVTHLNYLEPDLWTESDESGAPNLPYRILRIAVPPEGDINISYEILQSERDYLTNPVAPVATIIPDEKTSQFIYQINQAIYENYSREVVSRGDAINYNGYRVIPVYIYPVRYDHGQKLLVVYQEININIEILGNVNWQGEIDNIGRWLDKDYIANYEYARSWRRQQQQINTGIKWSASQFWYSLEIAGSGNYRLNENALADLPEWFDLSGLRIFSLRKIEEKYHAEEIALFIDKEEVAFAYEGDNSILWLAAGGSFADDPLRRTQITGNLYEINSVNEYQAASLRNDRAIECLLIRPRDYFEDAADELSEIHLEYFGVDTGMAIQEDIFNARSGGEPDETAIKEFLQQSKSDNPSLDYVVLMGSGTDDFENPTAKNKIITRTVNGVTSDDYFVDFDDVVSPDIAIGRIPAQSESMMNQYLERVRNYYDNMDNSWWQNRLLLVADDENKTGGLEGATSDAMNHAYQMEETTKELPGRNLTKLYGLEYQFDSYQNKPGVADDIIEALDEGCLVTYYIGHGSWNTLGDESYFTNERIPQLTNNDHLTVFLSGSCNVGRFSHVSNNCMAELLLFGENGGAIASIAASYDSNPLSNAKLFREFLNQIYNHNEDIGKALMNAKNNSNASVSNSKKYNLLGDPVLMLPIPLISGTIDGLPDSLQFRQTVSFQGDYDNPHLNGEGETVVYDSEQLIYYSNFIPPDTFNVYDVYYLRSGNGIFRGSVFLEDGEYESSFIVPDNAGDGNMGSIKTLTFDADGASLNTRLGIEFVDSSLDVTNDAPPEVKLYLDSYNFRSGDTVSEAPLLIADIADSSGVNLTINSGKNIMILLDDSNDPDDLIDATSGFIYKKGSFTRGTLTWELPLLSKGMHTLKLIVYDNFGLATVTSVDFQVISQGSMAITDVLPYPHPMSDEGYFTFVLTDEAEVTVNIYTISGRKIKSLKSFCNTGYNQIFWDCRDADGDQIANNNYFYKITAKITDTGKTAEKTGKLIILK